MFTPSLPNCHPRRFAALAALAAALVIGAATAADDAVPVGEWARFATVTWSGRTIPIHLRSGYERPLILPEPIASIDGGPLPGCEITIDGEVVLFAPLEHFAARQVTLVGSGSGTRYTLRVRSDALGKRIPLRIVAP